MAKSRRKRKTSKSIAPVAAPTVVSEELPLVTAEAEPVPSNGDTPLVQSIPLDSWKEEFVIAEPAAPTLRSIANSITLEMAMYAGIGIAALLLRITSLDARPLAPAEAQTALAAWNFLNGTAVGQYSSALLFTLDWLAFFLFGAFDLTARFLPALLSTSFVLIPALMRNVLGRTAAIIAALLIAFSPTLIFFARTLNGADLAVGASLTALILFWKYRESAQTRLLYLAAILAALALTADSTAYTVLGAGALYFVVTWLLNRRNARTVAQSEPADSASTWRTPVVFAGTLFVVVYVRAATTFLLNREGLGVAFNLLGTWLSAFSSIVSLTSPLNLLLVYEPLSLIFGLAGLVLVLTLRGDDARYMRLLRMVGVVTLLAFIWYSLVGDNSPSNVVAISMPMTLLAGWFIGSLVERATEDIRVSGGARSMLAGELPVFLLFFVLIVLVYLQIASFLQQTQFAPTLESLYRLFNADAGQVSLTAAALTLLIISILLAGVFFGLGVLLVGISRMTTLLAFIILLVLSLGMLRSVWQLNFDSNEPVRELLTPSQTPLQMRDLVTDLERYSGWRNGDEHVMSIAADSAVGVTGRWYLRNFRNVIWRTDLAGVSDVEAIINAASNTPPPGNWMGQRYRTGVTWQPNNFGGLELWKWFVFRDGGTENWQRATLWLTDNSSEGQ